MSDKDSEIILEKFYNHLTMMKNKYDCNESNLNIDLPTFRIIMYMLIVKFLSASKEYILNKIKLGNIDDIIIDSYQSFYDNRNKYMDIFNEISHEIGIAMFAPMIKAKPNLNIENDDLYINLKNKTFGIFLQSNIDSGKLSTDDISKCCRFIDFFCDYLQ